MTRTTEPETANERRSPGSSHEEALALLSDVQLSIDDHAHRLRRTGLPLDPYIEELEDLARYLEEEYHGFHGRERFSVDLHHGIVYAENREEAIRRVFDIAGPAEEIEISVDGEAVPIDEVLSGL